MPLFRKTLIVLQHPRPDLFVQVLWQPCPWLITEVTLWIIHFHGFAIWNLPVFAVDCLHLDLALLDHIRVGLDGLLAKFAYPFLCPFFAHLEFRIRCICI